MTRLTSLIALIVVVIGITTKSFSQVFMTKDEALSAFFRGKSIERRTLFLSEEQQTAIQSRGKSVVESKIVPYYIASGAGGVEGYAFLETNTVRTMPETFMVVIRPDSTVTGVEILAFHEPPDYLPGARWLSSFIGHRLSDDLWVKRDIPNITGATLSSQAITQGVRKIMAIFEIAVEKEARK